MWTVVYVNNKLMQNHPIVVQRKQQFIHRGLYSQTPTLLTLHVSYPYTIYNNIKIAILRHAE